MRLRTVDNYELIESSCYPQFVHDLVQTEFQKYLDKYGKPPRVIYLNHEETMALLFWSFKLHNKEWPKFHTVTEASFCDIPIKITQFSERLFK